MKAAVITVDMDKEKVTASSFFDGETCWADASAFKRSMDDDYKKPRYRNIVTADKEAKIVGLAALGITGLGDE